MQSSEQSQRGKAGCSCGGFVIYGRPWIIGEFVPSTTGKPILSVLIPESMLDMSVQNQGKADRESQFWLQKLINEQPEVLNKAIVDVALALAG